MKRKSFLLCVILIALALSGCTVGRFSFGDPYSKFDPETEGIVDVIVIAHPSVMSNRETTETRYYSLARNQRICLTEAFEPDPMTVYTVPWGCFESYIYRSSKVLNRLDHMALEDADKNPVPVSDEQAKIFHHIADLEHEMFNVRFLETNEETFVYLELNVNLWLPCCLYWYDRETDKLILLYKWDEEEVIGLHLRNIELAR